MHTKKNLCDLCVPRLPSRLSGEVHAKREAAHSGEAGEFVVRTLRLFSLFNLKILLFLLLGLH